MKGAALERASTTTEKVCEEHNHDSTERRGDVSAAFLLGGRAKKHPPRARGKNATKCKKKTPACERTYLLFPPRVVFLAKRTATQVGEDALVCLKVIKNNKDFFDQSLDEIKLLRDPAHYRDLEE